MKFIKHLLIISAFLCTPNLLFSTTSDGENMWQISARIADDVEVINSKICFINEDLTDFNINISLDLDEFEQTLCSKIDALQECILITQEDIGTTGYTISASGSYCLAETITHTNADNPAIIINANNVTLDLNDQHIICSGGKGGISIATKSNILIKDGVISSATDDGITITNSSHICIKNVKVFSCGNVGFNLTADESLIEHCVAIDNDYGIKLNFTENTCIRNCVSSGNTIFGYWISAGGNNVIIDSIALFNGDDGFFIANNSLQNTICNCIASENQEDGIDAASAIDTCIKSCKIIDNAEIGVHGDNATTQVFNTLAQSNGTINFSNIDGPIETTPTTATRYWSNVSQ